MASWRVKGYVSDSESEDDIVTAAIRNNLEPQDASTSAAPAKEEISTHLENGAVVTHGAQAEEASKPSVEDAVFLHGTEALVSEIAAIGESLPRSITTAEALQQTISQGLQVVREVLSCSPVVPDGGCNADDTDSPLSTPPDSPVIQPPEQPTANAIEIESGSQAQTVEVLPGQRSLRERNEIQRNPYTIDRAKYMVTLAGTGYKPIRDVDKNPKRARRPEESQESNFEDSSQPQESYDRDVMEIDTFEDVRTSNTRGLMSPVRDNFSWSTGDEELPDLDLLLNRTSTAFNAAHGVRSLQKARARQVRMEDEQIFDLPTSDDEERRTTEIPTRRFSSKTQQNSIPSPPRSMSVDSTEMLTLLRHPLDAQSPAPLPTPMVSSGIRPRKRFVVEDDSQSAQENQPARIDSASSSEDDTVEPERGEPPELRIMQRRVKGVLPASWWSIDRLQKGMKGKSKDLAHSAVKPRQEIGVAQRKSNLTLDRDRDQTSKTTLYEDLASEESDGDTEKRAENRYRQTSLPPLHANVIDDSLLHIDEAAETIDDDGIDPMLPTRVYTASRQRKREADLRGFVAEQSRKTFWTESLQRKHVADGATKSQFRSRKKARRNKSNDTFNVLDAPDLYSVPRRSQAPFLRIAARHVKKGPRHTGPSASRKFFQLSTSDDTDDVLHSLRAHTGPYREQRFGVDWRSSVTEARHVNIENGSETLWPRSVREYSTRPASSLTEPQQRHPEPGSASDTLHQEKAVFSHPAGSLEEDANASRSLRVTRLRSLLPVRNRSGQGQLATKPSIPRAAQIEVVLPDYNTLSRRVPKAHSLTNPAGADHQRNALEDFNLSTTNSTILRNGAPSHGRRKLPPRWRENVQQTLLISELPVGRDLQAAFTSNDPNIKALLHAEFTDYQTAWFQGRKFGVLCANSATQNHFDVFIRVLKDYLSVVLQDSESVMDARELNSFIHRLLPNRREIGAQGQIGDKSLDVLEHDISVARNVFDLYVCLLNLAPGCAPRPRVLEMMVNFTEAHHEICVIAMSAWKEIYTYHHADPSIVNGLASWMYSILSQLLARWAAAEIDARADAGRSNQLVAEQVVRQVISLNRCQACQLLCETHRLLEISIRDGISMTEASMLLDLPSYLRHLDAVSCIAELAEEVPITALQIATTFAEQTWTTQQSPGMAATLLSGIRNSIATLTTSRLHFAGDLQKVAVQSYFTFAQITVKQRQKHWDNFFVPTSSFSLDMFVSRSHIETTKTLFYHMLVEHETYQYFLDFRSTILNHWLRSLFQNRDDNLADLLTLSLFKHENESLAIPTLASSFSNSDGSFSELTIKQSLPEIRYSTVMHIIPYLYSQEHNSEAEWLAGGLDDTDAVQLLHNLFSTMKETWISLNEQPGEQDLYTLLIHTALDQYEIYPRSDFIIDPWFLSSATFPQRQKHNLAKLLSGHQQDPAEAMQAIKEAFEQAVAHAQRYDQFDTLEQELNAILLPPPQEVTRTSNDTTPTTQNLHATFIRDTFPSYFTISHLNPYPLKARTTILNTLIHTLTHLECKPTPFTIQSLQPFTQALFPILATARTALPTMSLADRNKIYKLTGLIFKWTVVAAVGESPERFMDDVEAVCDAAAASVDWSKEAVEATCDSAAVDGPNEAIELLQVVMAVR